MPAGFTPLRRLIPRRSWFESHCLAAAAWAILSALLIPVILICITLFTDLVVHGRDVVASAPEFAEFVAPDPVPSGSGGLWGSAWRNRSAAGWQWLNAVSRRLPYLGNTNLAILTILWIGSLASFLYVICTGQTIMHASLSSREAVRMLRTAVYRQTLRLGPSDVSGRRFESAQRLFTDDTEGVREALSQWRSRWPLVLTRLPTLVLCMLAIDWRLAVQCLVPAAGCWWVWRHERDRVARQRRLAESRAESELRFLAEGLKNSRLIRGYHMEDFEQKLFSQHLNRLAVETGAGRKGERIGATLSRLATVFGSGIVLLLIALKVTSADAAIPLASAVALGVSIVWLTYELSSLYRLSSARSTLELSGDRIYRYLDEIPEVGQAVGAKFIEPVARSVHLEGLAYRKGNTDILRGIELKIPAKTQVAIVSLDPQLPRTLAYMLPRFIEPTSGRVLYDGQDIAWGTLESIRAETAYVGADDVLLSGTVLDNIICGDDRYSAEAATEAAKAVHAHSFIVRLPQGYETIVGENGEQLDPGQVFRIGLARAILRNPAVIIIEEPNALLDDDSKAMADDAYQRIAVDRTVIYLPTRLSTIRRSDQVIFLHEGKVEAVGSHSELRKSSDLYRHWDYVTFNAYRRLNNRTGE